MKLFTALLFCLISGEAFGQAAVQQYGAITPFNVSRWSRDHMIEDAGGLTGKNGRGVNPFSINDNNGGALNMYSKNNEHVITIGHDSSGAPVFILDGASYPFSPGNGNVTGPNTSTVNELTSFNDAAGKLLRQGAASLTDNKTTVSASGASFMARMNPNLTADSIIAATFGGSGVAIYDAIRGVAKLEAGSTGMGLVNAVSGYVETNMAAGGTGFPTVVALFGAGTATQNQARIWGLNTLLTDNSTQSVSSGTGRDLNNEFDFNVTSPNTSISGVIVQGASLSQPLISNAYIVGPLDIAGYVAGTYTKQWGTGFSCDNNVTSICMLVGVGGPNRVANQPSAYMYFNYQDSSNVAQTARFQAHPVANNGGGSAGFDFGNVDPTLVTNLGLTNGGFYTQNSTSFTNALAVGATAVSGVNIPSQKILGNYFDITGLQRVWYMYMDNTQTFQLATTGAAGSFNWGGKFSSAGNVGVNCSGVPTALFAAVGGIVTHC